MTQPRAPRRWWLTAFKVAVVAALVWGVHRTLLHALEQLGQYQWHVEPVWLLLAALAYLAALLPAGVFWYLLLIRFHQHPTLGAALRAYYIGHLGKYVPGKAMVIVLRAGLVSAARVDPAVAAASVFYETLTTFGTGAMAATLSLAIWFPQERFLILSSAGMWLASAAVTWPPLFRWVMLRTRLGRKQPEVATDWPIDFRLYATGWVAIGLCWIGFAVSLWCTLRGVGAEDLGLLDELPRLVASSSLALVAGFVSLVPGGAVVRELVLIQLMAPRFGDATATVAAIVLRLDWLIAELVASAALYWLPVGRAEALPAIDSSAP